MHWIEEWLGASPDGGDGSLELLIFLVAGACAIMLVLAFNRKARSLVRRALGFPTSETPTGRRP